MDAVSAYSVSSLAWFGAQAVPLILWPSFISTLLTPNTLHQQYVPASAVEQYFARSLGFTQLTVGALLLILSGTLHLDSIVDTPTDSVSPYANAVVLMSALYHTLMAIYSYTQYSSIRGAPSAYLLGCVGSSALAVFGLWVLLFAGDKRRISKRTGADKNTSSWPFKNSEADKKKHKKRL
ncbi:hypothetical protein QBC35DRAFT_481180 [Podospora australis]|uniref:Uncharacterized protein n=1 Tax=Podospora australis TaxID=1536484 RepID=A0AAN6X719_9PEZI|nr:hypothetical protein QBC35DRAFT_481180 [Podospora australis]